MGMPHEGALEFLQRNSTSAREVHRKAMITRLAVVAGRRTLCKPIPSWLSAYRYASTLGSKRAFRGWQYTHENRTAWSGRLWSAASFSSSSSGIVMSPLEEYESLVKAGKLHSDPSQLYACRQLDLLFHSLKDYTPGPLIPIQQRQDEGMSMQDALRGFASEVGSDEEGPSGFFSSLFSSAPKKKPKAAAPSGTVTKVGAGGATAPKGLYMYGGVGCGKTMVMDMFYASAPAKRKRRVHFNQFMLECHDRMHRLRQNGLSEDPIPHLARNLLSECYLLCFDEFQVTDIGDALLLKRLFDELFSGGIVVVATSNRPPDDLYYNGIQRHLFLPFISQLKQTCNIFDFDSKQDYRLEGTVEGSNYITPIDTEETNLKVASLWKELTKNGKTSSKILTTKGRNIHVPLAAENTNVARFTFADLCEKPLGAGDYIKIAQTYHTIFLLDIPVLTKFEINEMRRFITLIDILYEHDTKVVFTASADPMNLFKPENEVDADEDLDHGDLLGTAEYTPVIKDEVFAFDRTISRLTEMQSTEYLRRASAAHTSDED
eukprot:g6817.t1